MTRSLLENELLLLLIGLVVCVVVRLLGLRFGVSMPTPPVDPSDGDA